MKTSTKSMYIILDKGRNGECHNLYREIEKIAYAFYCGPSTEFHKEYPMLGELYHGLKNEMENNDS